MNLDWYPGQKVRCIKQITILPIGQALGLTSPVVDTVYTVEYAADIHMCCIGLILKEVKFVVMGIMQFVPSCCFVPIEGLGMRDLRSLEVDPNRKIEGTDPPVKSPERKRRHAKPVNHRVGHRDHGHGG